MNEREIRAAAETKARELTGLSDRAFLRSLRQKYVKLTEDRESPGGVETKKAWVATFEDSTHHEGGWIELVLDDDGTVLRVDQSR